MALLGLGLVLCELGAWLMVDQEKRRQRNFVNLIPSENFTSQAVLDALGSVMQSKDRTSLS